MCVYSCSKISAPHPTKQSVKRGSDRLAPTSFKPLGGGGSAAQLGAVLLGRGKTPDLAGAASLGKVPQPKEAPGCTSREGGGERPTALFGPEARVRRGHHLHDTGAWEREGQRVCVRKRAGGGREPDPLGLPEPLQEFSRGQGHGKGVQGLRRVGGAPRYVYQFATVPTQQANLLTFPPPPLGNCRQTSHRVQK